MFKFIASLATVPNVMSSSSVSGVRCYAFSISVKLKLVVNHVFVVWYVSLGSDVVFLSSRLSGHCLVVFVVVRSVLFVVRVLNLLLLCQNSQDLIQDYVKFLIPFRTCFPANFVNLHLRRIWLSSQPKLQSRRLSVVSHNQRNRSKPINISKHLKESVGLLSVVAQWQFSLKFSPLVLCIVV